MVPPARSARQPRCASLVSQPHFTHKKRSTCIFTNLHHPFSPGPLLYHPAPILVDPRPQHAHDTLYCACQFSLGPAPAPHLQWSSTAAAPPAITPLSERPSTVRKHSSWAGPSACSGPTGPAVDVDVERSTTHDVRTLNIRLSGGHLRAHYTPPNHNAAAAAVRAVSLDKATVERIRAEIRNDLERVRTRENGQAQAQAQQAPTAQPETTRPHDEHIKHDLAAPLNELPEDEKEKLAKMRDKVRKELSAAYDEKMKALEARELDIQRRMDAIRKREAQWIESYGEGVIKGKPAGM